MTAPYPPCQVTARMQTQMSAILAKLDCLEPCLPQVLQEEWLVYSVQASLAIENNPLTLQEVQALSQGRDVPGQTPKILLEARNCLACHKALAHRTPFWTPTSLQDMLKAHGLLMQGLLPQAGSLRSGNVGVFQGGSSGTLVHMAPPARFVHAHLTRLLQWLGKTDVHPLAAACFFHGEFEYLHPFADGNGRMGRLWQRCILARVHPIFLFLPVDATVLKHRQAYYQMLGRVGSDGEATAFVEFMLQILLDTITFQEAALARTDQKNGPCRQ